MDPEKVGLTEFDVMIESHDDFFPADTLDHNVEHNAKGVRSYLKLVVAVLLCAIPLLYLFLHPHTGDPPIRSTIVTAYFPLESKHSHSEYNDWMANFLSLQDAMVIFTSPEMVSTIRQKRAHAINRTLIIPMRIKDLQVASLQGGTEFWKRQLEMDPEKGTHKSYQLFWIWLEKTNFVARAIELNIFQSDFFAWMDIGMLRDQKLNGKQLLKYIPHNLDRNQQVLLLDTSSLVSRKSGISVGGTVIAGYTLAFLRWHKAFYDTLGIRDNLGRLIADRYRKYRSDVKWHAPVAIRREQDPDALQITI
eukprot:GEMP01066838.1.p1 GENE.GEMP01066838.1~~GEMP01066838.1.p1  ORF type:complete len:329 (+),score=48.66 GEMP01066838.1:71-988(+)